MRGYNNLQIIVYDGATRKFIPGLPNAEGVRFGTIYPAGLFSDASMFIPMDATRPTAIKEGYRVVLYNRLMTVWEGFITRVTRTFQDKQEGIAIDAIGAWGHILGRRRWRKPWAETRMDDTIWPYYFAALNADKCTVSRSEATIKMVPKNVAWGNGAAAGVIYTAPTGQTIKRIAGDYDLQQGAQNWQIEVFTVGAGADYTDSTTGTGSFDFTISPATSTIYLFLRSNAAQTPASDGSIYGEFSNVVLYGETGSINLTEITKDIRDELSGEFSTANTFIESNSLSLVPFVSDWSETMADTLARAASYGDSSYNRWAVGVRESALATDNLPVLFAEQAPSLDDVDYVVRLDEPNVNGGVSFSRDISRDSLHNWIIVEYTGEDGKAKYITPDDDANLTDSDSVSEYGQSDYVLSLPVGDSTLATAYARRYLDDHKDPQWQLDRPLTVRGYIRALGGSRIPASQIRAGKVIKIENYLDDLSGEGLRFIITRTRYDDERETCTIEVGQPDTLDIILAQRELGA